MSLKSKHAIKNKKSIKIIKNKKDKKYKNDKYNENNKYNENDKYNENNIKTKKVKILLILFVIIFVIAITSYEIWAYFTNKTSKINNINLGYNKISVNENYEPPLSMEKGISFKKEPYVTNTGNVDCYVRVKSVISDSRIGDYLTINYNTTDFTYNEQDGYWYYKNIIPPGESTNPLFTTVTIGEDVDDIIYEGFDIYVYAESVQSVEGLSMEEVWKYFES